MRESSVLFYGVEFNWVVVSVMTKMLLGTKYSCIFDKYLWQKGDNWFSRTRVKQRLLSEYRRKGKGKVLAKHKNLKKTKKTKKKYLHFTYVVEVYCDNSVLYQISNYKTALSKNGLKMELVYSGSISSEYPVINKTHYYLLCIQKIKKW